MAKKKKVISSEEIGVAQLIASKFGKGVITSLESLVPTYELSTGSTSLDYIMGGGVVCGITEFFGGEGGGKTSLALGIVRDAQEKGINTYYIDQERGLTASLVNNIPGLNVKEFSKNILRPHHGQECCDVIEMIVKQSPKSLIVLDSIPAMISSAQIDESASKEFYAVIPKILSNFLPKIKTLLSEQEICLVLLNQLRMKMTSYGDPNDTPGGKALKFYCDRRVELRKAKPIKKGEKQVGHFVKCKVVKNKYAAPYQVAEVPLIYGKGIESVWDIAQLAIQMGIIKKKASWFIYEDKKWQGELTMTESLAEDKDTFTEIEAQVKEMLAD